MVEKVAGDGGAYLSKEAQTNRDTFRMYIEWVVLDVTPVTFDSDGNELTPEVETPAPLSFLAGKTISFFKRIASTEFFDNFDINPIKLDEETSVPVTLIPGGRFRVEVSGLADNQRMRGAIYSKLV